MTAPINVAYARVVLAGSMPGGEKWACGLAILRPNGSAADAATAIKASSQMTNLLLALRAINPSGWTAASLTVYMYAAGAANADDVGTAALTTTGQSTAVLPNQTALVTTLRSALATGRGRGRAYWPASGIPMAGAGLADNGSAQAVGQAVAAFLTTYKGLVVSHASGTTQAVTSVTVDNRTDVIRARAERLVPVRTAYPVTV